MAHEIVPSFDRELEADNVGYRWKTWIERFKIFLITIDTEPIDDPAADQEPSDEYKKNQKKIIALLLHYMGPKTYNIYNTLKAPTDSFNQIITKMTTYFNPNENMRYSRTIFRQLKQQSGEPIDNFVSRLKEAAVGCDFTNIEEEIITQVSVHGNSQSLKKQILITNNLTLANLLKMARMMETVDQSINVNENVYQINTRPENKPTSYPNHNKRKNNQANRKSFDKISYQNGYETRTKKELNCGLCGYEYPHINRKCPANGKTCSYCKKPNHFATVCRANPRNKQLNAPPRQTQINQVNHDDEISFHLSPDDVENDHVFTIDTKTSKKKFVDITLLGQKTKFLIDTGTTVNIIDESTFFQLNKTNIKIEPMVTNVYGYASSKALKVLGKFSTNISYKEKNHFTEFVICGGSFGCILGLESLEELNIIKITCTNTVKTDSIYRSKYPNLFSDKVGKIKGIQIKLHVDESVKPVQLPHRRIPFHLREKVEKEIHRMLEMDIIEPVNGPTPWVSPIVVVPKPGQKDKIRICTDARLANQAIRRERHITPTLDDIIVDLNGAKHISKFDLNGGYHQLELHPDSRYITVFSTHFGLFQYKRLNFGINCAAEIFQNEIRTLISPVIGAKNVSDDMLVHGKTKTEHDERINKLLNLLDSSGATLNPRKVVIDAPEIEFYGMIFSGKGIRPSNSKIDAIKQAKPPRNPTEVRSLLGLSQFISRFIPNFATITEPLWDLTKLSTRWHWNHKHDNALQILKDAITSKTLAYFNSNWKTKIVVDASPVGLGAVLIQLNPANPNEQNILAYGSRLLTEVERRYSQIEKEALAPVWACEKFHLFIFGQEITIETDNKAVELIFRNPSSNPPARIQRWLLRLSQYNFIFQHRPGKNNPADYLSRNPVENPTQISPAEEYINFIEENMTPKSVTLEELIKETKNDNLLVNVINLISSKNYVESDSLKIFKNILNQLTVSANGLILKDSQIVIPEKLQNSVIKLAHEGHIGIAKTKALLREHVWFPNLNKKVEEFVQNCIPCLATVKQNNIQEIHSSEMPDEPWNTIAVDFYGPIFNTYLLVVICLYSRFVVIEKVNSTAFNSVFSKLNHLFSILGKPRKLKSDNGPPFNGYQFANFLNQLGIKHLKITPEWPKANGLVERFMKSITKTIQAAVIESKIWELELEKLVRSHNSAPHSTTGVPPKALVFKFDCKTTLLPDKTILKLNKDDLNIKAEFNDIKSKQKIKEGNIGIGHNLKPNDRVLVKQKQTNKHISYYDPNPYEIVYKKGTMITAHNKQKNHTITRNMLTAFPYF